MTSHTFISRNNQIKGLTKFSVVVVHTSQNFRRRVNGTNTYKYRQAESKNMDSESFASASYYTYLWTTANNQQILHVHICPDLHYTPRFKKTICLSWNSPSYSKYELSSPEVRHHIEDKDCLALTCAIRLTKRIS